MAKPVTCSMFFVMATLTSSSETAPLVPKEVDVALEALPSGTTMSWTLSLSSP